PTARTPVRPPCAPKRRADRRRDAPAPTAPRDGGCSRAHVAPPIPYTRRARCTERGGRSSSVHLAETHRIGHHHVSGCGPPRHRHRVPPGAEGVGAEGYPLASILALILVDDVELLSARVV